MLPPCAQAVRFGGVLLLALAAAPGAAGTASGQRNASVERPGESAPKKPGGAFERQRFAQGPQPGAASREGTYGTAPPGWLRYSSERFRTLMRMLAARSARSEAARAAKVKAAAEAEAAEQAKRSAEAKRAAEAETAEQAKRSAEAKVAAEAKRVAEAEAAAEAKRAAEAEAAEQAKRAEEAKRVAEAEAAAKRAAEAKAAEEVKRAAQAKVAEEVKRAAQAKVAEEEAKRSADARKAVEITQAGKAPSAEQPPARAKEPAQTRRKHPRATCRNAGVKVRGSGWYVVQAGDSLWSIARAHYGYGRAYRRIHAANRRTIWNPARIYPCQRIYIPRSRLGTAPLQGPRVALAPFVRRRAMDTELPGLED